MKHVPCCNSVRLWEGDNKTRLFPFNFQAKRDEKDIISEIDYKLSMKLLSGKCVDISDDYFIVDVNDSFEDGTLKYPRDDSKPALLEKEELILYITTKFKEE